MKEVILISCVIALLVVMSLVRHRYPFERHPNTELLISAVKRSLCGEGEL